MNIVVTGSLGHISKPLTEDLVKKNHDVTVISSSKSKSIEIEQLGATAAIGSVEDVEFLSATFTGADAVYCMTPPNFGEPDQVAYYARTAENYATAILKSNVKRVIYLSSYGAHLPSGTGFVTGAYKAEQIFNAIPGINVTHVRPTFFYYNLLGFIPMIKSAGFIGAVYGGDDKLALVAPEDIAPVVSEELTEHTGNRIRYVASDDRSCSEIAHVLGTAIGKPDLKWNALPPENVLQYLQSSGIPKNAAENLVELGSATHSGRIREDYQQNRPAFGKVRLEEFAKQFAAAYNQEMK